MSEADRAIAEVQALLGEIRSIRADIERDTRQAIEEHEAYLAQVEPEDEERARRARSGELGPDWQRLQRQIDLGETSTTAVVAGVDDSLAAENVRRTAAENAREVMRTQDEAIESDDPATEELQASIGAARRNLREMQEQIDRIRRMPLPEVD
jgi:DNA-binding GntR family transcriptional regulator